MADGTCVKVVGPPVKFGGSVNNIRFPPPLLGQDTKEVLSQVLGYSEEKIKELKENCDIR